MVRSGGAGAVHSHASDPDRLGEGRERPLRVTIVEAEPLYADLLRFALGREPGVVAMAVPSAVRAMAGALTSRPDVYLIGDPLPGSISATQLGKRLRALLPSVGVVILADAPRWSILEDLPKQDLNGWCVLLRTSAVHLETLLTVLRGAASGRLMMSMAPDEPAGAPHGAPAQRLTHRQRQILWLVSEGYTNEGIAQRLNISERSVENSMYRIYAALGIRRHDHLFNPRVQAAKLAFDLAPPAAGSSEDA